MSSVTEARSTSPPQHYQDDAQNTSGGDDTSGGLKVGDPVEVDNPGDSFQGSVGIVHGITNADHGYNIQVDLEGSFGRRVTRTFRSDQLDLVGRAAQQPTSQQFPQVSNADAPPYWQRLSTGTKIGIAVAAVGIVLLVIVGIVVSSNTPHQAHSPSYQMGYDAAAPQPGIQRLRNLSDAGHLSTL
jgi:hypothetical protein